MGIPRLPPRSRARVDYGPAAQIVRRVVGMARQNRLEPGVLLTSRATRPGGCDPGNPGDAPERPHRRRTVRGAALPSGPPVLLEHLDGAGRRVEGRTSGRRNTTTRPSPRSAPLVRCKTTRPGGDPHAAVRRDACRPRKPSLAASVSTRCSFRARPYGGRVLFPPCRRISVRAARAPRPFLRYGAAFRIETSHRVSVFHTGNKTRGGHRPRPRPRHGQAADRHAGARQRPRHEARHRSPFQRVEQLRRRGSGRV